MAHPLLDDVRLVLSRQPLTISSITALTKSGERNPEEMKPADDWKEGQNKGEL